MPRRETLILAIDYVISRLTPRRYLWYLLKVNAGKHTCRRGELLVRIYYRIYIYIYIYMKRVKKFCLLRSGTRACYLSG